MRIAVASDHGGFELKSDVSAYLLTAGHDILDFGAASEDSCDYPDFGFPAAVAVSSGEAEKGILFCTTGIGMSILANKVPGVRAALCLTMDMASMSRRHNDANVLVLPGRYLSPDEAKEIAELWLGESFEGGRHSRRVEKITRFEDESGKC